MTKTEHELVATRQQRDAANNQVADLYGQLMIAQARVAELEKGNEGKTPSTVVGEAS